MYGRIFYLLVGTWLLLVSEVSADPMSDLTHQDILAKFAAAAAASQVGVARKTCPVDARPAKVGEIIVTLITGEGQETESKPAATGDMVVRNRCPETGDEQYLVSAAKFLQRYAGPFSDADADGWQEYRPLGPVVRYFIIPAEQPPFQFTAPWGEAMVARAGDAIVQDPHDPDDTYRVAAKSFACTYEIIEAPGLSTK